PMRPSAPAIAIRIVFLLLAQWFGVASAGTGSTRIACARVAGVDQWPARLHRSGILRLSFGRIGVRGRLAIIGWIDLGTRAAEDGTGLCLLRRGIGASRVGADLALRLGVLACAGVRLLEGLSVRLLVAFPTQQAVAIEPDRELALLFFAVAGLVIVGVIPAIGPEYVLQGGCTQNKADL